MDEKTIKKLLGLRIKQLRKKLQLTQFALGEIINLDQRQIAYIEGGNSFPSLKTLNKICYVFNCQIKDLFDFEHLIDEDNVKEKFAQKIQSMNDKKIQMYYQMINLVDNYV